MQDQPLWQERKMRAATWYQQLRDKICHEFEHLEDILTTVQDNPAPTRHKAGRFKRHKWQRDGGGGGVMSVLEGRVFEKVGVNISQVHGTFSPEFRKQIPGTDADPRFWACGVSLVAHMQSPLVPAVHMNTRMIVTQKGWFGGGTDLTPMRFCQKDYDHFHETLKQACDPHNPSYYPRFSAECREYFWLKHREEERGVGGIFYDYLDSGNWEKDFAFNKEVGNAFLEAFVPLVKEHMHKSWSEEAREHQLVRRGRYVEYNLLYDRGTAFGLKTGGKTEAILMSLPPAVKWPSPLDENAPSAKMLGETDAI